MAKKKEVKKVVKKKEVAERKLAGKIVHYFGNIGVAVIKVNKEIKIGDTIEIDNKGETFEQKITSMQVNHKEVKSAKKGNEVGMKVNQPVKVNALVYLK